MAAAYVQNWSNSLNWGTTFTVTIGTDATANTLLVAQIGINAQSPSSTPTGWTEIQNVTLGTPRGGLFYRIATGDSNDNLVVAWGSNSHGSAVVCEYSGLDSASPLEQSDENESFISSGQTNGDPINAGSATPDTANGLAVTGISTFEQYANDSELSIDNSYTKRVYETPGANRAATSLADKVYTSTAAQSPNWDTSLTSTWIAYTAIAVFKEAAAGGATIVTTPPNSTWAAVNAAIEATAGGATIVTTPANSTWAAVSASINAKTEIATTPPNSTWASVSASVNAKTIISTTVPNASWATVAAAIEADTVISTTPPNSIWAGINANILIVSPDADQPTGGWDYPQKPDPYEERVRQGIIQPEEPKKNVKLVQRVEQIPVDFEQIKSLEQVQAHEARLQELQRLHEEVKRRGIKKAQKEQLDREVLIKITLALNMLEQQKQLIEEQDIVFVMMMLAA